jgi:hypothetical protein
MTAKGQNRFIKTFLLFVAIWPGLQLAMSNILLTSPWRFMGFAMYTSPHDIEVTISAEEHGQSFVIDPRGFPHELKGAYQDFLKKRRTWGRLYSPKTFLAALSLGHPAMEKFAIDIAQIRLIDGSFKLYSSDKYRQ